MNTHTHTHGWGCRARERGFEGTYSCVYVLCIYIYTLAEIMKCNESCVSRATSGRLRLKRRGTPWWRRGSHCWSRWVYPRESAIDSPFTGLSKRCFFPAFFARSLCESALSCLLWCLYRRLWYHTTSVTIYRLISELCSLPRWSHFSFCLFLYFSSLCRSREQPGIANILQV